MHLINDKNLIPRCAWTISDVLNNFTNIINAGCRSCIHLNHINMTASHNIQAMKPRLRHVNIGRIRFCGLIIQRPRQNTRGGCLPNPTDTCQHKGVSNTTRFKSIAEGLHHRFLTDHIVKYARAIFPRQNLIGL